MDFLKDDRGQAGVAAAAVGAVVGVIGILIFATIYVGLNKDTISSSARNLLDIVDLVLAAVLIIGIVGFLAYMGTRR
jgi:preprotein translocase subunit Sss1